MSNSEKSSKKKFEQVDINDSITKRTEKAMVLETPYGDIVIQLFYHTIPIVQEVARRAVQGKYSGITFCNRNSSFIQLIKHPNEEKTNPNPIYLPLKNSRGTVGLVNSKRGPRAVLINDFYICFKEIKDFDEDGTIIGKVIQGMNLIKKINNGFKVKKIKIINIKKHDNLLLKIFFGVGALFSLPYIIFLLSSLLGIMKNTPFIKIISSPVSTYMVIVGVLLMLTTFILNLIFKGKLSGYEEEKGLVNLEKPSYGHIPSKHPEPRSISESPQPKIPSVPSIPKIENTKQREPERTSKVIKGKKPSIEHTEKEKMRKPERDNEEIEDIEANLLGNKEIEKPEEDTERKISTGGSTETHLDELYNLLEKKGMLKIDNLAKSFKVSKKEILDWSTILAEHGLAEINYPAFGGPILKKKELKKATS